MSGSFDKLNRYNWSNNGMDGCVVGAWVSADGARVLLAEAERKLEALVAAVRLEMLDTGPDWGYHDIDCPFDPDKNPGCSAQCERLNAALAAAEQGDEG